MKSVLVTGGTGVLGSAIVAALCEANFCVFANYWRDEARALHVQHATGCELLRADASSESGVDRLFESSYEMVIHCAGGGQSALLMRTTSQNWQDTLRLNLDSAFLITRASLKALPRGSDLVLMASRVGEHGFEGQGAYASSKAGVLALMKTASIEGREQGIRVNAICPGFALSDLSSELSSAMLQKREKQNLIPNADARESVAALCVALAQGKLNISGQILRPDCRI